MRSFESGAGSYRTWSHPPGSNRRPADYEAILKPQITENKVNRVIFAAPPYAIAALVEQVSERVTLFETTVVPP